MRKTNGLIFLLALIKFVLPYLLQNSYYEPHRDEFLYLAEGYHLAWGFMEVPPMLSIFAWLTHLFGDGMFWIKFWPNILDAFDNAVLCPGCGPQIAAYAAHSLMMMRIHPYLIAVRSDRIKTAQQTLSIDLYRM